MEQTIRTRQNVSVVVLSGAVLLLLIGFYFYENILRIVPTIITQDISASYHLNAKYFSFLVAAFYFTYAPMQLFVGVLLDRYGSRWLLIVAILSCSLGILLFAEAHDYFGLLFARVLMGFGASFAFVSAIKLLDTIVADYCFAMVSGVVIAIGVLGSIFGHVLLRYLMADAPWRLACVFLSAFGLMLAAIAYFILRKKTMDDANISVTKDAVTFSELWGDLRLLLSNSQFWINASIASLFYIPILGFTTTWQANFLQEVRYFDFDTASNALVVVFLGWGIGAPFFGWLSQKTNQTRLLMSLAATVTTILLASIIYVPHLSFIAMHVLLFMFGFCSSVHAINFSIVKRLASKRLLATAVALTNMVIMIGSVAICFLGFVLDWVWEGELKHQLPRYSEINFQTAFSVLLMIAFVALVLSFFLKEGYE